MATPPHSSDFAELAQQVAEELVLSRPIDDLVLLVCEQTGWDWAQAEQFVLKIEAKNLPRRQKRQNLFLLLAGCTSILGGLAVFAYFSYIGFLLLSSSMIQENDWISNYFFFNFLANQLPFLVSGMLVGLGLIAGGAYGLGKAFAT